MRYTQSGSNKKSSQTRQINRTTAAQLKKREEEKKEYTALKGLYGMKKPDPKEEKNFFKRLYM